MNHDDNTGEQPVSGSPRRRTAAVAAAVGVAGLVAGGLAAGTLSSASAAGDTATSERGYGVRPPAGEGESGGRGPSGRTDGDCPEGARPGPGGGPGGGPGD
ncbi:MAG: hypothetical protein ABWX73_14100, partial [Marmoricola sp.]